MTDIVIGKSPIKSATMNLLGKRRWRNSIDEQKEDDITESEMKVLD